MRIRSVAIRVLALAIPLTALGAGIPALRAAIGAEKVRTRPPASQPVAPSPTASPTPAQEQPKPVRPPSSFVTEDLFSITLPPGWSGGEIDNTGLSEGGYDAKRVWRYEDGGGRFFIVLTDPDGSDPGYDEVWRYRVEDRSFRRLEVYDDCVSGPDDPYCGTGDDRFDVMIYQENEGGSALVGGHHYYFMAGNTAEESADGPYLEILESVRVH